MLNGFPKAVVPHTLVIALDAEAHATFTAAGLVSYFDPNMPAIDGGAHDHRTAAFMDIMKLRLLYLAEVLLRGYSALLTDADAVFAAEPFAHFPADAALSVACDATVVPRDWAEAPGMVMAGFFFARGAAADHPDQGDPRLPGAPPRPARPAVVQPDLVRAPRRRPLGRRDAPAPLPQRLPVLWKQTVQREGIAPSSCRTIG